MSDVYHNVGDDLQISSTGDIALVSGLLQGQQRVLRRLVTNPDQLDAAGNVEIPGDYIFHPEYGAGLARMVGSTIDADAIKAKIQGQMFLESCVAQSPRPTIAVAEITNGAAVYIQYVDAPSGQPVTLAFDVNR